MSSSIVLPERPACCATRYHGPGQGHVRRAVGVDPGEDRDHHARPGRAGGGADAEVGENQQPAVRRDRGRPTLEQHAIAALRQDHLGVVDADELARAGAVATPRRRPEPAPPPNVFPSIVLSKPEFARTTRRNSRPAGSDWVTWLPWISDVVRRVQLERGRRIRIGR